MSDPAASPASARTVTRYRIVSGANPSEPPLTVDDVDHPYAGPIVCLWSEVAPLLTALADETKRADDNFAVYERTRDKNSALINELRAALAEQAQEIAGLIQQANAWEAETITLRAAGDARPQAQKAE